MKGKKIVVTGGAGFIGSNLVRRLIDTDNYVTIIDDLSTGKIENIQELINNDKIDFVNGSITNIDLLQTKFKDVDYVFHQAAIPSVPRSVADPVASNYANINGTLNVLIAARDNKIKKVVYASSSSVYGDTPTLPKKEDMQNIPLSPYAVTKITGEYYSNVFTNIYNIPTTCLRYFNVYGPKQDPNGAYAAVIPKFINLLIQDKSPVIYGDGEQTRDFTYIDDVIQINILACESNKCGIFNVAGGKRITLNKLTETMLNIFGKNIQPVYDDPRPGDIKHSLADITKAKNELGYNPKYEIEEGLKETVEWFQKKN